MVRCRPRLPAPMPALLLALALIWPAVARAVELDATLAAQIDALAPVAGGTADPVGIAGRVTVVSFFASWCPPCLVEFKHLNELRERFPSDDLAIRAVNWFEASDGFEDASGLRMKRFLARTKPNFDLRQGSAEVTQTFDRLSRIPTVYVFDRNGKQVYRFIHARGAPANRRNADPHALATAIKKALE